MTLRHLRLGFISIVAVMLTACGTVTEYRYGQISHPKRIEVERVAFNPSDIGAHTGISHLVGRAYVRDNRSFQERVGGFIDVVLNPVSKASTQWFTEVCRHGKVLKGQSDALYQQALIQTKTNNYGQFAFPNVPSGEYYLSTRLYWLDEAPRSGPIEYGGLLAKKINLQPGAQTIDLSQLDKCPGYYH